MESRLCPVCRKGKVWLRHVRTCSFYCSKTWRTWSPDMQANAVEAAQSESLELKEDMKAEVPPKPSFLK